MPCVCSAHSLSCLVIKIPFLTLLLGEGTLLIMHRYLYASNGNGTWVRAHKPMVPWSRCGFASECVSACKDASGWDSEQVNCLRSQEECVSERDCGVWGSLGSKHLDLHVFKGETMGAWLPGDQKSPAQPCAYVCAHVLMHRSENQQLNGAVPLDSYA